MPIPSFDEFSQKPQGAIPNFDDFQKTLPGTEKLGGKVPGVKNPPLPGALAPSKSAWEDPTQGLIGQGVRQVGRGVAAMAEPGMAAKYGGLSDVIHGVGRAALPAAIPFAVASPLSALGGAALGYGGSKAAEKVAEKVGAGPEAQALSGDIGGLAAGGIGSKLGASAESALARPAIKTALRLPAKSEAFGNDPAQMALEHTSGFRPLTIAKSAQDKMNQVRPEMENLVANSPNSVDLAPSRTIVSDARSLASRQGNKLVHDQLQPMGEALEGNRITGAPYTPFAGTSHVSAPEALDLKRGFGDEFTNFNPDIHKNVNSTARNVYGDLSSKIHQAVPGSEPLDRIMQGLIPVKHAAERTDMAPSLGQRVLSRVAAKTGGMLPALAGFEAGGIPGAMLGLTGAEAAASPVPMAIAARALHGAGKITAPPVFQLPLTKRREQE